MGNRVSRRAEDLCSFDFYDPDLVHQPINLGVFYLYIYWSQKRKLAPLCSLLNIDRDNFLSVHRQGLIMEKHSQIWFDGIPDHIADLQRSVDRAVQPQHSPIILDADIQLSTFAV